MPVLLFYLSAFEDRSGFFYLFPSGNGGVVESIGDTKLLPLEGTKSMVGQDFHALYVGKGVYKLSQVDEVFFVVSNAGHEDVTDPNRFSNLREKACTVENVFVAMCSEPAMLLAVDVFDVEQQQVGNLHELLKLFEKRFFAGERLCSSIETSVDASLVSHREEFYEEVYL